MQLFPPTTTPQPLLAPSIGLSHARWILFSWQFNKNFQQGQETVLYLETCRVALGSTQEVMVMFTLEQAMKVQRMSRLCSFFNLCGRCSGWSTPCLSHSTPERPSIRCIMGWVGPRPSLDGCRKPHPHGNLMPVLSSL